MIRGKRIALYGIPKCGKTSQADILVQTLRRKDFEAEYKKYPQYQEKPSGSYLNEYLNKHKHQHLTERELQLWFTLNRMQYQPKLDQELEQGTFIITENDIGMSYAYGVFAGVKEQWLNSIMDPLLKPDVSIVIESERPIDHAPSQTAATLRSMQGLYKDLATRHAWYIVNGDQKMMEVHTHIWDIVKKVI